MRNTLYVFVLAVCPYLIPTNCFSQNNVPAVNRSNEILDTVTWKGITTNWHDAQNWSWKRNPENGIPDYNIDVVVQPVSSGLYPVLTTGQVAICNSISLSGEGVELKINPGAAFNCFGNFVNNSTVNNLGKINLMGVLNQGFPGPGTITAMQVLQVSKTAGSVVLNKNFFIDSALLPTSGILALGDYDITLRSTPTRSAYVGVVGSPVGFTYGNGRFIVQRYISQTRKWQLLSIPTNSTQSIWAAWQDAGSSTSSPTGFGVQITGPIVANGIDAYSASPSLKFQSGTSVNFTPVSNTNQALANPKGYYLYVYGNRAYTAGGIAGAPTTLQTRGKLFVGNGQADQPSPVSAIANLAAGEDHMSLGNPFAASINFTTLLNQPANITGNFKANFKVWDPSQPGLYESGLYQTITGPTGWLATPGGGTMYNAPISYADIQPGQAFYVEANASGPVTVHFSESVKSVNPRLVNKGGNDPYDNIDPMALSMISAFIYSMDNKLLDGNRVVLNDSFSNAINQHDAGKHWNLGANFGILKNNHSLCVETRPLLQENDTIQYDLYGLYNGDYQLRMAMQLVDAPGLQAFLGDRYLNSESPVSLLDSARIDFTVNNTEASKAPDRFYLVFRRIMSPLQFISCHANWNTGGTATIHWKVVNQAGTSHFELQRSLPGQDFTSIRDQPVTNSNEYSNVDGAPHHPETFYRIKAITSNGSFVYSNIVKLSSLNMGPQLLVAPNPVENKSLVMQLKYFIPGAYSLRLWDAAGSLFYKGTIQVTGPMMNDRILLNNHPAPGVYQLCIYDKEGKNIANERVLIK